MSGLSGMLYGVIDAAIDRLAAAHRDAGLPPIRPAPRGTDRLLAEIAETVRPFRLPPDLVTFWRRVDPASLTVGPFPEPCSPDFALRTWVQQRDEPMSPIPLCLFPFCYQSHVFVSVELATEAWPGGPCFYWSYDGEEYELRYPSLAAWVDLVATMVELGVRPPVVDDREWVETARVRLAAALPIGPYGSRLGYGNDPRDWPPHWQAATGFAPESWTPRGATATVAELLARAARDGEARGTVVARVTSLAGSAAGARIVATDATGDLDVWCPARVAAYGLALGRELELDVVVRGATPPPDLRQERGEVQRHALAHDLPAAQAAASELYQKAFGTPAAAEATAIRPAGG